MAPSKEWQERALEAELNAEAWKAKARRDRKRRLRAERAATLAEQRADEAFAARDEAKRSQISFDQRVEEAAKRETRELRQANESLRAQLRERQTRVEELTAMYEQKSGKLREAESKIIEYLQLRGGLEALARRLGVSESANPNRLLWQDIDSAIVKLLARVGELAARNPRAIEKHSDVCGVLFERSCTCQRRFDDG